MGRPLDGKVALVTGAGKGIGAAICRELGEYGANLVMNYAHSAAATEDLAEEIARDHGVETMTIQADVSNLDQVCDMMDQAWQRYGRIDYLINNAGITRDKTFRKLSVPEWHEVIDTNLNGVFYCIHGAMPHLIEQGNGSVINISSIVAQMGNFGQANYAAAKGGLFSFSKTLALEWARYNISVNCVAPGFIETDMLAKVPDEYKEKILQQIPLRRFGKPEEVAKAVRFLCVDGDYITGQVIAINGGMYM
ncbi:MAG: 3-oxoacyl-ACP reductase FabG [Chloroflexi bacterium]|nr:3-oxoacyl-ACP reductase FabG [Chloroflexota bacterium]